MKQLSLLCTSCKKNKRCALWKQLCEIDEEFVKAQISYIPGVQEVGIAVTRCSLYEEKRSDKAQQHISTNKKVRQTRRTTNNG